MPHMTAMDALAINEGRHKRNRKFDSESKFSIKNMLNYGNYSSAVEFRDGKMRPKPVPSSFMVAGDQQIDNEIDIY